jgi:hypothetical protein
LARNCNGLQVQAENYELFGDCSATKLRKSFFCLPLQAASLLIIRAFQFTDFLGSFLIEKKLILNSPRPLMKGSFCHNETWRSLCAFIELLIENKKLSLHPLENSRLLFSVLFCLCLFYWLRCSELQTIRNSANRAKEEIEFSCRKRLKISLRRLKMSNLCRRVSASHGPNLVLFELSSLGSDKDCDSLSLNVKLRSPERRAFNCSLTLLIILLTELKCE